MALGRVLDLMGSYEEARKHLTKAIALAKPDTRNAALTAMAVSYAFEWNAGEAAKYFQKVFDEQMASQAHDAAAATANALGRVYLESGDLDNAYKWYETGFQTAGKIADLPEDQKDLWAMRWHHAQARIAARRGSRAEADKHLAELKALVDKNDANRKEMPIYHYLAGYVAFYAGDYDRALAELQMGDLDDPFIQGLIAQAYEKKGDTASARKHHERVMASTAHNINSAFSRPRARRALGR
jgi:tetratricopeptide (TPR) repeat protein